MEDVVGDDEVEALEIVALRRGIARGVERPEAHEIAEASLVGHAASVVDEHLAEVGEVVLDVGPRGGERLDQRPGEKPLPSPDLEDTEPPPARRGDDPGHQLHEEGDVDSLVPVLDRGALALLDQASAAAGVEDADGLDSTGERVRVARRAVIEEIEEALKAGVLFNLLAQLGGAGQGVGAREKAHLVAGQMDDAVLGEHGEHGVEEADELGYDPGAIEERLAGEGLALLHLHADSDEEIDDLARRERVERGGEAGVALDGANGESGGDVGLGVREPGGLEGEIERWQARGVEAAGSEVGRSIQWRRRSKG